MNESYYEKLRDPRWQKIRLKVFERDSFTCTNCNTKTKTLSVHHGYYEKGIEPWDYDIDTLHCVCLQCHDKIKVLMNSIYLLIAKIPLSCLENNVLPVIETIPEEIEAEIKNVRRITRGEL